MHALFRVILRNCERSKGSAKSLHADGRCDTTFPCDPFFGHGVCFAGTDPLLSAALVPSWKSIPVEYLPTVNFQQEATAEKSGNDPSMVSR